MRKVIGLIPLWDDERESYWMLPGYMKLIEQCGGLPMMLPMTDDEKMLDQALGLCDGLLLTGGHDVSPTLYGQEPLAVCGKPCVMRDRMESYLLRLVLEKDMPVLGICRGIQLMNVCLGGTLYQDIPSQHPSDVNHQMTPPYDRIVHSVEIQAGTILAGILGVGKYEVNSYHHQAVCRLSPYVTPSAVSEDGLVEAIEIKEKRFALGVQWHPEFIQDDGAMKLVRAMIHAC